MGTTTLQELLALPGPERLELAMTLWQSLDAAEQDEALPVDAAFCAELEQRWARYQQNPENALDWEVVRQDLDLA
jgi:putative addiction module component (TIGR02574 family)